MDYRTFVVPYDFSPHAAAALETAANLARRLEADIHLVHVLQLPLHTYPGMVGAPITATQAEDMERAARDSLSEAAAAADVGSSTVETHVIEGGRIADAIRSAAADLRADLIVMGTHGRTGWAHVFLGSVAERTLRQAPCPVLTVRATDDDA